jgi:hypothetical protein
MDTKKIMFEIFRERHDGGYRVVYYTELGEHQKDYALAEAMNGEYVYSGYILHRDRDRAKSAVDELLVRLNHGEQLSEVDIESQLQTVCV